MTNTPPDHTEGLARLRLLHAQRLDFDRETVGGLLDQLEAAQSARLLFEDALRFAHQYAGCGEQPGHGPVEACAICDVISSAMPCERTLRLLGRTNGEAK